MSELSDISIKKPSVGGSPTGNTMVHGVSEKARQSGTARVSSSTKLPFTNRMKPPLVTPLMDNGGSMEEDYGWHVLAN